MFEKDITNDWVVVVLSITPCDIYPAHQCVMEVVGPLESKEAANAEAAKYPEAMAPHTMQIRKPWLGLKEET